MSAVADREAIARAALEEIAARGLVTSDVVGKANTDDEMPTCPEHGWLADPGNDCDCGGFQCEECGHLQPIAGPCANRECLTSIARRALDEMRGVR